MQNNRDYFDFSQIDDRSSVLGSLGWNIDTFKTAKVMVIGAGALGNEVLKNLALIGVEHLVLVDFDVVERSNLAKSVLYREEDCTGEKLKVELAAQRIKEINPSVKTLVINGDLTLDIGLGVFRRMDAIIGCVDNRLTRLWINRFSHWLGKTWIDGGIEDLGGQLTVFKPGTSCYECQLSPQAWENIQFRMGCTSRAMRYASSGIANTTPITSSIIGAMQVQEALKLLANPEAGNSLAGEQFYYEGMNNTYMVLPASAPKEICHSHKHIEEVIKARELSASSTVKHTLAWVANQLQDDDISISLDYELVLGLGTERSEKEIALVKPRPKLTKADFDQYREIEGEEVRITQKTNEIEKEFPFPNMKLSELGVAPLHILSVVSGGVTYYIELTGDENFFKFK